MADTTAMTNQVKPTFLGVPEEIREAIITQVVALEQADGSHTGTPDDTTLPQKFDFSVNANGFRCHSMKSFNLLFVNKQVHYEAIRILYRHSSVVLYAEVSHNANDFGFIPFVLANIPAAVKANVQTVGVNFYNVANPLRPTLCPSGDIPREKAARKHLVSVVNTVMNDFVKRKTLHIIAGIKGAKPDDLKVLFKLFAGPDQTISLEEIYQSDGYIYSPTRYRVDNSSNKTKKIRYDELAKKAAVKIGQEWFQNAVAPTLVEDICAESDKDMPIWAAIGNSDPDKNWRGASVGWARRRVWKRNSPATPLSSEMAEWLKERI